MKLLPKIVFGLYLIVLLWLVLFKLSSNIPMVLEHHSRSLNLIPFVGLQGHVGEALENILAFIPFGLLFSASFKQITLRRKLAYICICSVAVETVQFMLAIGVSDITDVITNTLGGLLGLLFYKFTSKHVDSDDQDQFIAVVGMGLLVLLLLLRFFMFKVRY